MRRTEKKNVVARQIQIGVERLSSPTEEEVSEELLRHLLLLPTYLPGLYPFSSEENLLLPIAQVA